MKGTKGRFLKRIRSISSTFSLKQHGVPLCNEYRSKIFVDQSSQTVLNYIQQEKHKTMSILEPREEEETGSCLGRENLDIILSNESVPSEEIDIFEECECQFEPMPVMGDEGGVDTKLGAQKTTKELSDFEERCPPGGAEKVILYTTSLRGIRKTYEDCNAIKFLLESLRVMYIERDVSMHLEFRDELWGILGGRVIPPRLFIRGKHIGGADEVVALHELGALKNLLQGIPKVASGSDIKCGHCGGARFLMCEECCGSCKVYNGEQGNGRRLSVRCPNCNENGLVKCPTCS